MANSFQQSALIAHSPKAAEIAQLKSSMVATSKSTVNIGGFVSPMEMKRQRAEKDVEVRDAHISDPEIFGQIHAVHKSILISAADPMGE